MKSIAAKRPEIRINFSEAWWLANYGPRAEKEDRRHLLWERFGDVGMGEKDPSDEEIVYVGDCGDRFMSAFWGCEIVKEPGQAPAALPLPSPLSKMKKLEVPDVKSSPAVRRLVEKVAELKRTHKKCIVNLNYGGPLNNGVSIFGEEMLMACASDPCLATEVLMKMAKAILVINDEVVCSLNGIAPAETRKGSWGIGNCPVCMISPTTYANVVLPADLWTKGQFAGDFALHHCGIFDAYTEVYKPLNPRSLDLGPGSSLRIARAAYPNACISTYLDAGKLAKMTQPQIDACVGHLCSEAGKASLFTRISVADTGPETSDETVRDLMTVFDRIDVIDL